MKVQCLLGRSGQVLWQGLSTPFIACHTVDHAFMPLGPRQTQLPSLGVSVLEVLMGEGQVGRSVPVSGTALEETGPGTEEAVKGQVILQWG